MGSFGMNVRVQEKHWPATAAVALLKSAPLWIFVLALSVRLLIVSVTQFDGLYGQDAFAYLECAEQLTIGIPCGDFHWPYGYPVLAALFMRLTHASPFGAQLASILTGAAVAPLTYWTVAAIAPGPARQHQKSIAVSAGLIAALSGQLILSSIVIMSDAPGLFWATLSACMLFQWERSAGNARLDGLWLPAAAAALAVATTTRWIFGGLILPFGIFTIIVGRRRLRGARSQAAAPVTVCYPAEYASFALAALALCAILLLQLYLNSISPAPVLRHPWVVNWNPVNTWHRSFDNPDGHFRYPVPPLLFYAAPFIHPLYLSPLLTGCALYGAWQLRHSPAFIILGGWIATLYVYLMGIPYENGRFPLAFFPPVAILAGIGVWALPSARPRSWPRWLLLAVSLAVTLGFTHRAFMRFDAATRQQLASIRYLGSRVPPASTVVTFGLSISLAHYTHLAVVDLFMHSPQSLRPIICGNQTAYLFIDEDNIESQWMGRSPATNFHWLRESVGLERTGTQGTWTLYRVRPCAP